MLRGHRAVFVLDLVEQSDDLGSLDAVDRAGAELGIDIPPEHPSPFVNAAKVLPFPRQIFLRDRLKAIAIGRLRVTKLLQRVSSTSNGALHRLRFTLRVGEREG